VLSSELHVWQRKGVQFAAAPSLFSTHRRFDVDAEFVSSVVRDLERLTVQCVAAVLTEAAAVLSPARTDDVVADALLLLLSKVCTVLNPGDQRLRALLCALRDRTRSIAEIVSSEALLELAARTATGARDASVATKVGQIVSKCKALGKALRVMLANASFSDARDRHSVLERVDLCLQPLQAVLDHPALDSNDAMKADAMALRKAFRTVRDCCSRRSLLLPLYSETFVRQWRALDDSLNAASERSAAWALKREMSAPAVSSHNRIEAILRFLVQHVEDAGPLNAFGYLVLWLGATWRVELAVLESNAFGGDVNADGGGGIATDAESTVTLGQLEALEMDLRAYDCLPLVLSASKEVVDLLRQRADTGRVGRAGEACHAARAALVTALQNAAALDQQYAASQAALQSGAKAVDPAAASLQREQHEELRIRALEAREAAESRRVEAAAAAEALSEAERGVAAANEAHVASLRASLRGFLAIRSSESWRHVVHLRSRRIVREHQALVRVLSGHTHTVQRDECGALNIAHAMGGPVGEALRVVDFTSQDSCDLLLLWCGIFFSSLVLPAVPSALDFMLVDCLQSSLLEAIPLPPLGSKDQFTLVTLCYALEDRSDRAPLSLVVLTSGYSGSRPGALMLHHYCSVDCVAQRAAVDDALLDLRAGGWVVTFVECGATQPTWRREPISDVPQAAASVLATLLVHFYQLQGSQSWVLSR
jgi:hypothetical protein